MIYLGVVSLANF